jgi:Protein of unknown function (DUF2490)
MKKFLFIVPLLLCAFAFGQKTISNQQHAWTSFQGNHKLNDHWGIHTEYQWRREDFYSHWQQSLLRLGVDYYSKNKFQYTAGYGWIKSFLYGDQPIGHETNEHRIWEQFQYKTKFPYGEIVHRYRLEQRFIENWVKDAQGVYAKDGYLYRNRFRYRFLVNIPLNKREMGPKTLFLTAYDEVFLGFGKGIAKNILDQNRANFGIGWMQSPALSFQIGYLNQFVVKTDAIKMERNHTLNIGFTYNFIRKPKV